MSPPRRALELVEAADGTPQAVLVPDAGHAGLVEQGPKMAAAVRDLLSHLQRPAGT